MTVPSNASIIGVRTAFIINGVSSLSGGLTTAQTERSFALSVTGLLKSRKVRDRLAGHGAAGRRLMKGASSVRAIAILKKAQIAPKRAGDCFRRLDGRDRCL